MLDNLLPALPILIASSASFSASCAESFLDGKDLAVNIVLGRTCLGDVDGEMVSD